MPTQTTKRRKAAARKRGERSPAENHLRRGLAMDKKIKDDNDDLGLYNWLRNLHSKSNNDHRSQWEKDLEERLRKELKIKA